ncbi:hypothetical protein VTN00DRAFT_6302 [Thermoascus crustaceus]|uniref:uncharacterized protein n=1 Tax=Thermoascus crustaceus TaxID=5088 RepID=UPI0037426015
MATPASASTPSSAASPPALTPAPAPAPPPLAARPVLCIKPSAPAPPAASPGPGTPGSVTTKEWVIPPRPKPGRKPATDTPPTKRKAQNRAAQRAFRERRAARVGELEEQIKKIEEENESRQAAFKEQISNLSREVEQCRNEISWWRDRCHSLEKEVAVERSAKEALVKEFRSSAPDNNNSNSAQSDTVPLPPRRSSRNIQTDRSADRNGASSVRNSEEAPQDVHSGCSNCSSSHCQCIEDAFNMPPNTVDSRDTSTPKRPHSPLMEGSSKRHRSEPEIKPEPEEMEIDFTSRFAAPQSHADPQTASPSAVVDPCGFCQDGTPCICAEMAAQEERERDSFENNRLAPIQNLSQFTPPPSDGDVRSELTLPPISQTANPCVNGPGTCAQCLKDPRSTLFCKTLAASRSASASSGCCGGKGADGGCCQSRPSTRNSRGGSASTPALTLTCADTFTTLSRHPNFSRASDELSTWLPKLHTLPNPRDVAPKDRHGNHIDNRPAMEVEAASVMGVLRYFDRRFADK